LFYKSADGQKFSGPYFVDQTSSPIIIQSNLQALNGSKTLNLRLETEFLTADRMRMKSVAGDLSSRVLTFQRMKDDAEGAPRKVISAVPEVKRPRAPTRN
jgi:hypothetical protein